MFSLKIQELICFTLWSYLFDQLVNFKAYKFGIMTWNSSVFFFTELETQGKAHTYLFQLRLCANFLFWWSQYLLVVNLYHTQVTCRNNWSIARNVKTNHVIVLFLVTVSWLSTTDPGPASASAQVTNYIVHLHCNYFETINNTY